MTTTRTVRWDLTSDKEIEVRITATRAMVACDPVSADGHIVDVGGTTLHEYETIRAYVDGRKVDEANLGEIQHIRPKQVGAVTVVAILGTKVGLSQRQLDLIEAARDEAIADAGTDPDVVAYRARQAAGRKIEREHDEHVRSVERMMTLDGGTY